MAFWKPIAIQKTVTTAGTRVQASATSIFTPDVTVQALASNTGVIYVGDVTVSSTAGIALTAGQSVSFSIEPAGLGNDIDLSLVYLDSSVNGEKANVMYTKRA